MRKTKGEVKERREKVKELYLQKLSNNTIAKRLGISRDTVGDDVVYLQKYYVALSLNNPDMARRQYERINKLLDEIEIVKKEMWELNKELKDDKTPKFGKQLHQIEEIRRCLKDGDVTKVLELLGKIEEKLETEHFPRYKSRIDTLKAIVSRTEHEAKIASLFNPSTLIVNNYISINDLKGILEGVKSIIIDLVPADKRVNAMERMKLLPVNADTGKNIIEAELVK